MAPKTVKRGHLVGLTNKKFFFEIPFQKYFKTQVYTANCLILLVKWHGLMCMHTYVYVCVCIYKASVRSYCCQVLHCPHTVHATNGIQCLLHLTKHKKFQFNRSAHNLTSIKVSALERKTKAPPSLLFESIVHMYVCIYISALRLYNANPRLFVARRDHKIGCEQLLTLVGQWVYSYVICTYVSMLLLSFAIHSCTAYTARPKLKVVFVLTEKLARQRQPHCSAVFPRLC